MKSNPDSATARCTTTTPTLKNNPDRETVYGVLHQKPMQVYWLLCGSHVSLVISCCERRLKKHQSHCALSPASPVQGEVEPDDLPHQRSFDLSLLCRSKSWMPFVENGHGVTFFTSDITSSLIKCIISALS